MNKPRPFRIPMFLELPEDALTLEFVQALFAEHTTVTLHWNNHSEQYIEVPVFPDMANLLAHIGDQRTDLFFAFVANHYPEVMRGWLERLADQHPYLRALAEQAMKRNKQ